MYAAANGHASALSVLISLGANLTLANNLGTTATHVAGARGHIKCLKMLLAAEPELIDKTDDDGNTMAMIVAKAGMPKVLRVLVRSGADLTASNANGLTATLLAASNGHAECLRVLLLEAKVAVSDDKMLLKHARWGAKTARHEAKLREIIDNALAGKHVPMPNDSDDEIARAAELVAKAEAEAAEAASIAARERQEAVDAARKHHEAAKDIAAQEEAQRRKEERAKILRKEEEKRLKEEHKLREQQLAKERDEDLRRRASELRAQEERLNKEEREAAAAEAEMTRKHEEIEAAKRLLEAARARDEI
jgi:hypothetical protein